MRNKSSLFEDLHRHYKKTLEASFVVALLILCSLFFSFQKHVSSFKLPVVKIQDKEIEVVPITNQHEKQKPRPTIPSPAPEDEEMDLEPDAILKNLFEFDPSQELTPPPEDEDIGQVFFTWQISNPPEIKYKATPPYPELPRKAGIEGRVVVEVTISKKGRVIAARIISGVEMLNEAALKAAKECTFYPAKQRDKFVKVKMYVPFDFRLH